MEKLISLQIAFLVFTVMMQIGAWIYIFYATGILFWHKSYYHGRRVMAVLSILLALLMLVWGVSSQYMTAHQDINAVWWFSGCAAGVGILIGIVVLSMMREDYRTSKYKALY